MKSTANKIAKHFIFKTNTRATPAIMKKTHAQAKTLLSSGYTEEEIINTIDYLIDVKKVNMYSLGYVNTCINNVLNNIEKNELDKLTLQNKSTVRKEMKEYEERLSKEVVNNVHSSSRNKIKAERLGLQSRFREEFISNLFEGNR